MRNPHGYALWVDPDLPRDFERDTFTCAHCNAVNQVTPFTTPAALGGWCSCCCAPICPKCSDRFECTPFEKKLEAYERANRFAQQAGLVLD